MKQHLSDIRYQEWRLLYEVEAQEQEKAAKKAFKG